MSKINKIGYGLAGILGAVSPALVGAQIEYESQVGTTTELARAIGGDVLITIVAVVGIVAGIIVFVWGVGYTFSKMSRKTGMKKF